MQHGLIQQAQQGHEQPGQQNDQQEVDGMKEDEADNEWPAWNPTIFAVDNGLVVPEHPSLPQDHLDLNQSGSSMRFL